MTISDIRPHGPENAEHELRKAYNLLIEVGVTAAAGLNDDPGAIQVEEIESAYQKAYNLYRDGDRLSAERWARSVKHMARAYWHECKISWLGVRTAFYPYLEGAEPEDLNLHEHSDTTEDLLHSVEDHVPPGLEEMPEEMTRHLARARMHLQILNEGNERHELLRAERIKAAHEYGRILECLALAYEAEARPHRRAA